MNILYIKSIKYSSFKAFLIFLTKYFTKKNYNIKIVHFPTKINRITLLKSPHVHKKAKDSYEVRQYSCSLNFKESDVSINSLKLLTSFKPTEVNIKLIKQSL